MLTTNYNVVQLSASEKGKWDIGGLFIVPDEHRSNSRFMKFDELIIENITYGFGIFLHFNYDDWKNNVPRPEYSTDTQRVPPYLF